MMDLRPYSNYEFLLKGFIGATPSADSNRVIVRTLETVPDKIEHLHGYAWNETTVFVHWTPPNATNGPNFVRKSQNTARLEICLKTSENNDLMSFIIDEKRDLVEKFHKRIEYFFSFDHLKMFECQEIIGLIDQYLIEKCLFAFQYYILYYTNNASTPFDQWFYTTVRTYPFHVLRTHIQSTLLFVRVASVNSKGSILSDFHIINRSSYHSHLISTIDQFQCSFDDQKQQLLIRWSTDYEFRLSYYRYLLYYLDVTEADGDLIRRLTIHTDHLSIQQKDSYDFFRYELNSTELDLNYRPYHILRLYLSIIDQYENQLVTSEPAIYCTLTRKYGKSMEISSKSIDSLNKKSISRAEID